VEWIILLVAGAVAGTLAGLFGIGGGLIVVPALVLVYTKQGVANHVLMHLAIGTSLATIVTTASSSVRAHHKRGAIDWNAFRRITPGIIVGAVCGALIADRLDSNTLRIVFAGFLVAVATQMIINRQPAAHRQLPGLMGMSLAGSVIGTISSMMGVGGGTMSVPFLSWCNVPMRSAVATSAAIGLPIAIGGAISFAFTGWGEPDLPRYSLGYINLPAYVGIVITGILFAPLGARLAHRLNPVLLKRAFAVFLYIVALRLLLH